MWDMGDIHILNSNNSVLIFFFYLICLIPTPTLHRTLDWASCFISDQVLFRFLHSLYTVRLHVSRVIFCQYHPEDSHLFDGYAQSSQIYVFEWSHQSAAYLPFSVDAHYIYEGCLISTRVRQENAFFFIFLN